MNRKNYVLFSVLIFFIFTQIKCFGQSLNTAYQREVKYSNATFVDNIDSNYVNEIQIKKVEYGVVYNEVLNDLVIRDYSNQTFTIHKNITFLEFKYPYEHYYSSDSQEEEVYHIFINEGTFMIVYKDNHDGLFKKTILFNEENGTLDKFSGCFHENLSSGFDLQVFTYRTRHEGNYNETCDITIHIVDKKTKISKQTIQISSDEIYQSTFSGCKGVNSLSKGVIDDDFGADSFFGSIIIADFNFDGLEDLAIVNSDSNTGQRYNFYVQNLLGQFILDSFLTKEVQLFPSVVAPAFFIF